MKHSNKIDLRGHVPETWACIDCGINTHPGSLNREQMEKAYAFAMATHNENIAAISFDDHSEVYTVKPAVWAAAGMEPWGGCLCIGCLEKRIGRRLTPKDFPRRHPFNVMPGTDRLLSRRDGDVERRTMKKKQLERDFERFLRDLDSMSGRQEEHFRTKYADELDAIIEWAATPR